MQNQELCVCVRVCVSMCVCVCVCVHISREIEERIVSPERSQLGLTGL